MNRGAGAACPTRRGCPGAGDLGVELPGWATGPRAQGCGVSRAVSSPHACGDPHGVPNAWAGLGRGLPKNERPPEWAEAAGTPEPRFAGGSWQVAGRPGTRAGLVSAQSSFRVVCVFFFVVFCFGFVVWGGCNLLPTFKILEAFVLKIQTPAPLVNIWQQSAHQWVWRRAGGWSHTPECP